MEVLQKLRRDVYGQYSRNTQQYESLSSAQKEVSDFDGHAGICTYDRWPRTLLECWQRADFTNVPAATDDPMVIECVFHIVVKMILPIQVSFHYRCVVFQRPQFATSIVCQMRIVHVKHIQMVVVNL